jgi:hypothetical protein
LKTQFLWSGVGVTEYAVNKVLRPSVATGITEVVLSTIDKTVKPEIELIVLAQELAIDKILKPLAECRVLERVEVAIEKSLKPSIEYQIFNPILSIQIMTTNISAYVKISDITIDSLRSIAQFNIEITTI